MNTVPFNLSFIYAFTRFYQQVITKKTKLRDVLILLVTLASKKNLNIWIADDDDASRDIFIEAFKRIGPDIEVVEAVDGIDLMQKLAGEKKPDIIFLDLNMPRKTGQECLDEIRRNKKLAQKVLSLDWDEERVRTGREAFVLNPGRAK